MHKTSHIRNFIHQTWSGLLGISLTAIIICGIFFFYIVITLPHIGELKHIDFQVPLKIYTANHQLIGEFGNKRRSPVALSQVPPQLIRAILDTEDQRFYQHAGVDFISLMRAAKVLFETGEKLQGASTITMQVARNFFLTRKKTYIRKFREILLALKIDHALSKNKILELYLNKIYFGQRAYGVAAAAKIYYGEDLKDLTLPQIAMLAGLPQAPSRNNPLNNPGQALKRRNHVLYRMYKKGDINQKAYLDAINSPISASLHELHPKIKAPYVAEIVRSAMLAQYGDKVYEKGYKVYTTINPGLEQDANRALSQGLIAYNMRHGYTGASANWGTPPQDLQQWRDQLDRSPTIHGLVAAAVVAVGDQTANALLANGNIITIPWQGMKWAKPRLNHGYVGAAPTAANKILNVGDVIRVTNINGTWYLRQLPKVNGALVAINPHNGAIVALDGGFSFKLNKFNRAIQADRQPGSSFKPFIYSAALHKGFTLASLINDAPVVLASSGIHSLWRPQNVTRKFYGPTRLRIGLTRSRNLVSIRLLQAIGIPYTINYLQRFGFNPKQMPTTLSLALGTATLSPLQLATGYAVFANDGFRVKPFLISKIVDEDGHVLFQAHPLTVPSNKPKFSDNPAAPRTISRSNCYLLNSALQDVIKSGTGRAALRLKRNDLAGKTGTTNKQIDAWFAGFNGNLVATVWIGYDQPQSLHEYGAQAALPIWIKFMGQALLHQPETNTTQPQDIVTVRIDPKTGLLAYPGQTNAIFEHFRRSYVPKNMTSRATDSATTNSSNSNNNEFNNDELF